MQGKFEGRALRIGFVGTYPPTPCGIATFTASLANAIMRIRPESGFGVVACDDGTLPAARTAEVVASLVSGSESSRASAAAALNEFDVVFVQHEFGIYGGEDGAEVLDLVSVLEVPTVVVLHTVPRAPSAGQRRVIERLGRRADRLVVQSAVARARLLEQYLVAAEKVETIPHGARPNLSPPRPLDGSRAPVVLTWGLLGRDKGIEWGIEAIARLADLEPAPRYLIVGQTHPKVRASVGEQYRRLLEARAAALGVAGHVEFDDAYHDTDSLLRRVREADVVLLPYRSREQVVSGVLVEAVASGKPIVATRFPHAEELLGEEPALLVPHEDAEAIAAALRRLLTDPVHALRAAAVARRNARALFWESVAERYLALAESLTRPAPVRLPGFPHPRFDHLLRLGDEVGVFEHARFREPRIEHGYCTDDVARALVVLLREPAPAPGVERLAETCLAFLEQAQLPDGRFRNRRTADGRWLDQSGSDDANGRALWAAAIAAGTASDAGQRRRALRLFEAGAGFLSCWPRANAYALLGAADLLATPGTAGRRAAERLLVRTSDRLGAASDDPAWPWPEPRLAYANAVLAEARIAAGDALDDERLLAEGLALLEWLAATETRGDHFSFTPAGGWAPGEPRPGFDQQPIEAAAMVDACARAFDVTGKRVWAERALRAAAWFLGRNDVGVALLDPLSGGCRDGLERDGVNANEGAESTIALIGALQQARRLQAAAARARTSRSVSTLAAPMQRSAAP